MKERRKPVLGRVVPGVTPVAQRRLRGFYVFVQTFSSSLAGWLALRMFLKPPRRKVEPADAPIIALARRSTMRCGGDRFTVWTWEQPGPERRAAAWLGIACRTICRFRGAAACRRLLGNRHRCARSWHLTRPVLGSAPLSRQPRRGAARQRTHSRGDRSLTGRWRDSDGAGRNRRSSSEEDLPVRRAIRHGLHPRIVCDDARPQATCAGQSARAVHREIRQAGQGRLGAAAAPSVRIPVLVVHDEDDNVAPIAQGAALPRQFRGQ